MIVDLKCTVYLLFSIGSVNCIYELHCIAFEKNLGNSASGWLQSDGKFDIKCALWKQTVQQIFSNTKHILHSLGGKFLNFDLEHKQTGTRFLPREVIHLNSYSARVTPKLLSDILKGRLWKERSNLVLYCLKNKWFHAENNISSDNLKINFTLLNTATTTYALKFTCCRTGKNKHDMKKEKWR